MRLSPYREHKNTGIEWLGEIPRHWGTLPLRRLIRMVKTGGTPAGADDSAFDDAGFNWYTPGDFSERLVLGKSDRALSDLGKLDVHTFPPMTVMLVGIGATIGKVGISVGESSCNQQINGIVCGDLVDPAFVAYYLRTMRSFIMQCGKYTTLPIINQDETKSLTITHPPLPEQRAIAAFLDRETARIDSLIAKKQKQIDLLQRKRAALISQAVTKGLDPKVKMKDSGVEWVRHVPAHWRSCLLKRVADISYGVGGELDRTSTQGVPIISLPNVGIDGALDVSEISLCDHPRQEIEPNLMRKGDLLFNWRNGSASHLGKTVYFDLDGEFTHVSFLLRLRFNPNGCSKYCYYLLNGFRSRGYFSSSKAGVNNTFNMSELQNLPVLLPPKAEQEAIAAYLDSEIARTLAPLPKIARSVETLEKYRAALISAAVTGKIDVRQGDQT